MRSMRVTPLDFDEQSELRADRVRETARELLRDGLESLMPELKEHWQFSELEDEVRHSQSLMTNEQYAVIGRKLMILLRDTAEDMAEEMEKNNG